MYLPYKFIIALSQMVAMNIWAVVTHMVAMYTPGGCYVCTPWVVAMYTPGGCYVHPGWLLCTPWVVAMYTPDGCYVHPVQYVHTYVCMYACNSMYTSSMYTCTYVRISVCTYVCVQEYVCICIQMTSTN